jgi:sporulation protein YlmC with PRC-barrel domain
MAEAPSTDSPDSAPAPASEASVEAGRPDVEEARSWVGHEVDDIAGTAIGKLDGVLVDAQRGRPEWLVVRTGRFGQRSLVPARHAVGAAGHIWVPYGHDAIRSAPRGDGSKGLSRRDEQRLLDNYGIGAEAGRAAEIAALADDTLTAQPAG